MELPKQPELVPVWRAIRAELRRVVGDSTYEIWLSSIEIQAWDGSILVLQAPTDTQAWIAERFGRVLETCAQVVLGSAIQVSFAAAASTPARRESSEALAGRERQAGERLNPRYNFHQFIIGDGNHLAHAAALAVAELPGQAYNPLFLHGPPGLGKTHLLHAIGNYILAFGGGAAVRYTTVEAFTNHFIAAVGARSVNRLDYFKRAYRDADVLLIDDVQFLASKAKTEEEFFHTFNALYETGRQLVLTCDRLPKQLPMLQDRLRERFESGLVADIRPPDFATRLTILRKRAALDRIALADPAVLELIAERVTGNVRTLESTLIRMVAHHSLARRPIDVHLATAVLDKMAPDARLGPPGIDQVQAQVASFYDISVVELISASRAARVAWPRQVAIHLIRQHTGESLHAIGNAFGGRNHATVLHACKRVAMRLETDREASAEVRKLADALHNRSDDRQC